MILAYIIFFCNVIPNFIALSFGTILYVVAYSFKTVNEAVRNLLHESIRENRALGKGYDEQANELIRLRFIHEDLCESARLLEQAFGFQVISDSDFLSLIF